MEKRGRVGEKMEGRRSIDRQKSKKDLDLKKKNNKQTNRNERIPKLKTTNKITNTNIKQKQYTHQVLQMN